MSMRHRLHRFRHLKPRTKREIFLVIGSAILIVLGGLVLYASSIKIPDIASLQERKVPQSTKIYDRTGTILLDDLSDNVNRTNVTIDQISPNIQKATVAIEDSTFYQNNGIRITSIIRAFIADVTGLGYAQGGSTITQQVIKNSILTTDKTLTRKIKEWILAVKLDAALPKDKILELYLNETPYGGAIYGVEQASETYLGKPAKDLDIAESAYIAALPQAPTYYSPFGHLPTACYCWHPRATLCLFCARAVRTRVWTRRAPTKWLACHHNTRR